jgi:hypothetical protein
VIEVLRITVTIDVIIDATGKITFSCFTVLNIRGSENNFTLVGNTEFMVL